MGFLQTNYLSFLLPTPKLKLPSLFSHHGFLASTVISVCFAGNPWLTTRIDKWEMKWNETRRGLGDAHHMYTPSIWSKFYENMSDGHTGQDDDSPALHLVKVVALSHEFVFNSQSRLTMCVVATGQRTVYCMDSTCTYNRAIVTV